MPDLGKYAVEVLSAYAFSIALLSGLIYVYLAKARQLARKLKTVEDEENSEKNNGEDE